MTPAPLFFARGRSHLDGMLRTVAILCLLLLPLGPAAAQDDAPGTPPADTDVERGFNLLQEGSRLMLQGLMEELEPALRDLGDAIGDLSNYHAPEVLPNGDIIIRRKTPLPDEDAPEGEIEL